MRTATKPSTTKIVRPKFNLGKIVPTKGVPLKLKLNAAFQPREEGFLAVDSRKTDNVDYVLDTKNIPWPMDASVVDYIFCSGYFHRLDMPQRVAFMNECYRVLKDNAQLVIIVPNWSSGGAYSDPRSKWPPVDASFFVYVNKEWRVNDHSEDTGFTCDYDWGYGYALDEEIRLRNDEFQREAVKFKTNAGRELHVTLTKRPETK